MAHATTSTSSWRWSGMRLGWVMTTSSFPKWRQESFWLRVGPKISHSHVFFSSSALIPPSPLSPVPFVCRLLGRVGLHARCLLPQWMQEGEGGEGVLLLQRVRYVPTNQETHIEFVSGRQTTWSDKHLVLILCTRQLHFWRDWKCRKAYLK